MPYQIVRQDITRMKVDAIVNPANSALQMDGGVSAAILSAAGSDQLQTECDRIGGCQVGQAVITGGYELPAKYVIHTVGPIWKDGKHNEAQLLRDCYANSLLLARQYKCRSIAFPLISSGTYGYPKDEALRAATTAITDFLLEYDMTVYLVVFDKAALSASGKLFADVQQYIDDHYVEEMDTRFYRLQRLEHYVVQEQIMADMAAAPPAERKLDDLLRQLDESFSEMLLRLIDAQGFTDVQTYKRANIDRKLFSKIRSNKGYKPGKPTVIALAIALELNLDQMLDLMGKAGYTLSPSLKFDVIVEYFVKNGDYDLYKINDVLFFYDQSLLGA